MGRLATTVVMLLAVGPAPQALAQNRGPVCREPSVVDEMARQIRGRSYYSSVDWRLVTEQPGADPGLVRCQVCVETAPYDTSRFGDQPIPQCLPHGFEVRIVPTGFVVRDLR
jgi:hypothetical protein